MAVVAALAVVSACAPAAGPVSTSDPTPSPASVSPFAVATESGHGRPDSSVFRPAPKPAPAPRSAGGGPVVVLDPGHDGGNAAHPEVIDRPVDAGGGRTKPCNTVGASTVQGYPEHAFTWDVTVRARALLASRGVRVVLTRKDDAGVGPCVDARARVGNAVRADAVLSVHADGGPPDGSGFHVIEAAASPPGGTSVAAASHRLALAVRDALGGGSGLGPAAYVGSGDGLVTRGDLAGLNLSTRPTVIVECGNIHNSATRQCWRTRRVGSGSQPRLPPPCSPTSAPGERQRTPPPRDARFCRPRPVE